MDTRDKVEIAICALEDLRLTHEEAQAYFREAVLPVLQSEGYVETRPSYRDKGVDLVGYDEEGDSDSWFSSMPVIFKYAQPGKAIDARLMGGIISSISISPDHDRGILVSNVKFTNAANEVTRRSKLRLKLVGPLELRSWANTALGHTGGALSPIARAVRELSGRLASEIAKRPSALSEIEWRDLERVMAEVFAAFGFDVELTPPAKDGGKDMVLSCYLESGRHSYFIEVKHWTSGKRVGLRTIKEFVNVVVRESVEAGLMLSTSGYSQASIKALTQIDRGKIRLGSDSKIVSLCRTFLRAEAGIWTAPSHLPDLIFSQTT